MVIRHAVVLVNMGGPSNIEGIKPFLSAILYDPFIIGAPAFIRYPLSKIIVSRRIEKVVDRYQQIGGASPLARWSEKVLATLRDELSHSEYSDTRIEYAFRYCSPTIEETFAKLRNDGIEQITLFPLFPHYTRAMTGSILAIAEKECKKLNMTLTEIPAWGLDASIVDLQHELLSKAIEEAGEGARVLFVAHGIPMSDVKRGDNYPVQVRRTAEALGKQLPSGVEWSLSYSSRLGPMKWLEPYIENEITRLGAKQTPLVIMQLSFVFDCLETLYDLDIVAVKMARDLGIPKIVRVPTFNDNSRFVEFLFNKLTTFYHA